MEGRTEEKSRRRRKQGRKEGCKLSSYSILFHHTISSYFITFYDSLPLSSVFITFHYHHMLSRSSFSSYSSYLIMLIVVLNSLHRMSMHVFLSCYKNICRSYSIKRHHFASCFIVFIMLIVFIMFHQRFHHFHHIP